MTFKIAYVFHDDSNGTESLTGAKLDECENVLVVNIGFFCSNYFDRFKKFYKREGGHGALSS